MKKRKRLKPKEDNVFVRAAKFAYIREYDARTGRFGKKESFYNLFWERKR